MGLKTRAKNLNADNSFSSKDKTSWAALITLSLASIFCLVAYLLFFAVALSPQTGSWAIEYEGPCLWASTMLARGLNPYPPAGLTASPFQVIIYPPFYFQICSLFLHEQVSYFWPRIISIGATVISAIFYYLFMLRLGKNKIVAWLSSLLLMSFMAVWLWSCKGRVDALSVALSIVGLYFYAGQSNSNLCASVLSLTLATLTKQPSALLVPALCLDLLARKRYRQAVLFGAGFLGSLAASVLYYERTTDGGFIKHMRFASHMPYVTKFLVARLELMKIDALKFILAVLAAITLIPQYIGKKLNAEQGDCLRLSLLILMCTLPVTFYTAGTAYSNINHFLVTLLPVPLLVSIPLLSRTSTSWQKLYRLAGFGTALLSGALLLFLSITIFSPAKAVGPDLTNKVSQETFLALVKDKTILAEDAGYSVLFGCRTEPVDITTFLQVLGRDGAQALSMKQNIENKKYAAVIINHKEIDGSRDMPQWAESLKVMLKKHYRLLGQINGNNEAQDVYVPKEN